MTAPLPLHDARRAELYQGLGRALGAGLPAVQAMDALQGIADGALDTRLRRASNALRKGTALPLALYRQGLLPESDRVLLTAAEDTGTLDRVCERLATRYTRNAARWRQMKGRLLLPAAVLLIAIIVLPLPAVASGELSTGSYLLRAGAMLLLMALIALTLAALIRQWRAAGTPGWLTAMARLVPGLARMSHLHERADVCERLSLAFASGMPINDALGAMRKAESNRVRGQTLVAAQNALAAGTGLADALERARLLDPSTFAMVSTGESAGRLEETLTRVAGACHDALDDTYGLLAQWIPIVLYLMVAGVVAVGVIG